MKTMPQPSIISPTITVLILLAAGVLYVGLTGKKVPMLSSLKLDMLLIVGLGLAICTQGGIGRIAASGQWSHPQAILGYILGAAILLVTLFSVAGWKLPFIQNGQQALLVIAGLIGLKFLNAAIHYFLFRV